MSDRWGVDRSAADLDWVGEDETAVEPPVGYLPDGLVTLRYVWDAVRRHVRLWVAIALLGLLVGSLVPVVLPPPSEATTRLLLSHREGVDTLQAMATDVKLVTTRTVASRVVEQLGLEESPDELLEQYDVAQVTDRIVEIYVRAPTGAEAKLLASTIANTFLEFRVEQVKAHLRPMKAQLSAAQGDLTALQERIERQQEEPDVATEARLGRLEDRVAQMRGRVEDQRAARVLVSSSRILDQAALTPRSKLKTVVLDVATGIAGGLVVGLGLVILRALVSDRVWRRQLIADALGAPVAVNLSSIGRRRGLLPARLNRSHRARVELEVQGVARHVRRLLGGSPGGDPALSIVALSDERTVAWLTAEVLRTLADADTRVLAADLSSGGWLAGELEHATGIDVFVPDSAERPPEGLSVSGEGSPTEELPAELLAAWDEADTIIVFTDVSLLQGLDHLSTWADEAVAVVSAGACTATRLRTTSELLTLAGVRLDSTVVLRGDRTDETAGIPGDAAAEPTVARILRTTVR